MIDNDSNKLNFAICIAISILVGLILGSIIYYGVSSGKDKEIKKVDTKVQKLEEQRDSIKLKITTIDSLQHEKVIEVQGLNNDSTLELFYKLIGK